LLVCRTENGIDGLQFTRSWLSRSADCTRTCQAAAAESATAAADAAVVSLAAAAAAAPEAESASLASPVSSSAANAVLNSAFLELLDWDDDRVFPEVISPPSLTLHPFGLSPFP